VLGHATFGHDIAVSVGELSSADGTPVAGGVADAGAEPVGGAEATGETTGGEDATGGAEGGALACGGAGWLPQPTATNITASQPSTLMPHDTPQPAVWLRAADLLFWYQVDRRRLFFDDRPRAASFHRNSYGGPMSSPISRTQAARPMHRIGARVGAGVVAIALSAAGLAVTAGSAQARPRSCWNIGQSMEFFWLAMRSDSGASAQYFAQDNRMYNYEIRLYNAAGC